MTFSDFKDVLSRIDTATTAIGANIKALVAQLAAGKGTGLDLTADEEKSLFDALVAEANKLEAIASPADPNVAIPPAQAPAPAVDPNATSVVTIPPVTPTT